MANDKYADAESWGAVSHVEPQSYGGFAADPTGSTHSISRGTFTNTQVSVNTATAPQPDGDCHDAMH